MMEHFLDLNYGDKTMVGDKTLEITSHRRSAAQVTKVAEDGDGQKYDIVIDARDESVSVIPWRFE